MAEGRAIEAAQLFSDDGGDGFVDAGLPRYSRRLTDKILAAFNHAYSMGELDIARSLWECLVAAEKIGVQQYPRRRPNQALDLAGEWVAFVDARDRYRDLNRADETDPGDAAEAFRTMREAHKAWRVHNEGAGAPAGEAHVAASAFDESVSYGDQPAATTAAEPVAR